MFSLDKNLCDIFPTDGNCLIIVWMITGPGQALLFFKVLEVTAEVHENLLVHREPHTRLVH